MTGKLQYTRRAFIQGENAQYIQLVRCVQIESPGIGAFGYPGTKRFRGICSGLRQLSANDAEWLQDDTSADENREIITEIVP
jgi:hypothetical protein